MSKLVFKQDESVKTQPGGKNRNVVITVITVISAVPLTGIKEA